MMWGHSASGVGRRRRAHEVKQGVRDVKAFDISHANHPRGVGRRHVCQCDVRPRGGRVSARAKRPITERQSLVLSRRSIDRATLLVPGRGGHEGAPRV